MKFATLAMVIATASASNAAAPKQCHDMANLGTSMSSTETCLCEVKTANPGCLTTD